VTNVTTNVEARVDKLMMALTGPITPPRAIDVTPRTEG